MMEVEGNNTVSVVDFTFHLQWEISQEEFENCDLQKNISSPIYTFKIGSEETQWRIQLYPKGHDDEKFKDSVIGYIYLLSPGLIYHGNFAISVKSKTAKTGYLPHDPLINLYGLKGSTLDAKHMNCSRSGECWHRICLATFDGNETQGQNGYVISNSTDNFRKLFVDNKICVLVSIVIYKEGLEYLKYRVATENFVYDVRSMSDLNIDGDFKIFYGNKQVKCPKALLASRSSIFKSKFELDTLDKNAKEMNIDDCSEEVAQALLDFMLKGDLPVNVDDIAIELIAKASYYGFEVLVQVCGSSLVKSLSVDNAAETLVLIDRYSPDSPLREKVIEYIKKEGTEVVKSKNWKEFSRNYPDLVTDLFLSAVKRKNPEQN